MNDRDQAALVQELRTRIAGFTTTLDELAPLPPVGETRWSSAAMWMSADELALCIRVAEAGRGWGPSATAAECVLASEILERAESRRDARTPPPRGR
jgi:hypothetical protein